MWQSYGNIRRMGDMASEPIGHERRWSQNPSGATQSLLTEVKAL